MSPARTLRADQRCRVFVVDPELSRPELIVESTERLFEAPNWSTGGDVILNGDGCLWRLAPTPGSVAERIEIDGVPALNNDHVLAPDGETIYLSADDGHIYSAPLAGGRALRVTRDDGVALRYLHGVSPDGSTLAYIRLDSVGDRA